MNNTYEKLKESLAFVRSKTDFKPEIGVVLGSGLGNFATEIKSVFTVEYDSIPGFPKSTVSGHQGRFVFGYVGEKPIIAMQGRVHYYEGYDIKDVVMPIRLMGLLGAKSIILTNASGGVNEGFTPGDLMVINDHIASFVPSPLLGENLGELGPRFPDMSQVYSVELRKLALSVAERIGLSLKTGVYLQASGPQYETPAEIKAYRMLGADAVGMSTACEAIAARHMGLQVCGISCITNMASGLSKIALSHDEVKKTAEKVQSAFSMLIKELIVSIPCKED